MVNDLGSMFKAMLGEHYGTGDGPYVHTFTPSNGWGTDLFDDPQTDAEWAFYDWWTENDAEEATAILLGPDRSFTVERTEWIGTDGAAYALGTEGEPTTPTMFIPLTSEDRP